MAVMSSLLISNVHGTVHTKSRSFQSCQRAQAQAFTSNSASLSWPGSQDLWCVKLWASLREAPQHTRRTHVLVSSSYGALPSSSQDLLRICAVAFTNVVSGLKAHPVLSSCAPPLAMIFFTVYGLVPSFKRIHQALTKKKNWEKSQMQHIVVSYVRPLLLWMGVISICRVVDPVVLSSAASQAIKDRSINFIRSLSTVLAFAVCTTNLTQQVQKSMERPDTEKGRNLGIQFISNAICTSVWVAAVCLFIELLGFSTQKWITAGGLGTVLVTLAGREIFTNFLSSVMIHATRPFSESQWIQTKIEGQEVSGTVEHVGWWSPTVIRGDDREAVHIPNHKFTVSVVRNLSQKTHWRIKTHLAISHLDAGKISLIVADMRKVLAKHPQVEHKRLHRRVFLDYIHPENQALHILISCFVKTSHFEEYLRVKEVILLDLLKVISHHKARLATPIRTMQRVSSDEELHAHTSRVHKPILISDASVLSDTHTHHKEEKGDDTQKNPKLEGLDSMGLNSKDITLLGAAFGKPMVTIQAEVEQEDTEEEVSTEVDGTVRKKVYVQDDVKEQIVGSIRAQADGKGGAKEQTVGSKRAQADSKGKGQENLVSKGKGLSRTPSVEENLVLGVALDGPKRTLPLESVRDGNGDKTEASTQPAADARERER